MIKFKCGSCKSDVELDKDSPIGCPVCGLGKQIGASPPCIPYIPQPIMVPYPQPYPYPWGTEGPIWIYYPTITCGGTDNKVEVNTYSQDTGSVITSTPYKYSISYMS